MGKFLTGDVANLFYAVADLASDQRSEFLDQVCSKESPLRTQIDFLLAHHDQAGVLDKSLFPSGVTSASVTGGLSPLVQGQILSGRFHIIRLIGSGGMGAVYEAQDLTAGVRLALKTIRLDGPDWAGLNSRLHKELRIARLVSHPNVCRVFEYWTDESPATGPLTFFTMELLEERTLAQRITEAGRLGETEAIAILSDVAAGLTAMHEVGIIHRDLKPANILLVRRDSLERAVIMDFGLARDISDDSTQTRTDFGTPSYMAPEQFQTGQASIASDVYAFGVVAFELVTGVNHPLVTPRSMVTGLSVTWDSTLLRCFSRNPAERPLSVQDVIARLKAPSFPQKRALWSTAALFLCALAVGASQTSWFRLIRIGERRFSNLPKSLQVNVGLFTRQRLNPIDRQKYVWVSGGQMLKFGCEGEPECRDEDKDSLPPSPVAIAGFWMGATEVTVDAYRRVTHKLPPAEPIAWRTYNLNPSWSNAKKPIVMVTWQEAVKYCEDIGGRLPREAEWEYAALAGSVTPPGYLDLKKIAWFADDSGDKEFNGQLYLENLYRSVPPGFGINAFVYPRWVRHLQSVHATLHQVADKAPNAFGLYDLLGNAWEWVASESFTSGLHPPKLFVRGGSWDDEIKYSRSSSRHAADLTTRSDDYGFRCVVQNIPEYEKEAH